MLHTPGPSYISSNAKKFKSYLKNIHILGVVLLMLIQGRKVGKKLWESASYLLWTLQPDRDVEAEYGCKAQHQSFKQTQTFGKILSKRDLPFFLICDQMR